MRTRDILWVALEQARTHGAPGEMRDRLLLSAEYATKNNDQLPPWLDFQPAPKQSSLIVVKEEESP